MNRAAAEASAAAVAAAGGQAEALVADALDPVSCQRVVDELVSQFGGLHILCNLVGYFGPRGQGALDTIELDRWQWMVDINLKSVFLSSRAAIRAMLRAVQGAIVNTGTLAAVVARGGMAYGASKAGVLSLTRAMASEYQPDNIRVNCVCPSATDSQMYWASGGPARRRDEVVRSVQGLASPEQIADVFLFLASDRAARVTGHILLADNGFSSFRQ